MNKYDEICGRFVFVRDMNGDFAFTITDVWLLAKSAFLLPATTLSSILHHSRLGEFFEINCSSGTGLGGAILSLLLWPFAIWLVFALLADVLSRARK